MSVLEAILTSRWVAACGAGWVGLRRRSHRPHADPLTAATLRVFESYFGLQTLDLVRVHRVPRIAPPWPLGLFGWLGSRVFGVVDVWGITYFDTIVLADDLIGSRRFEACLFHECVHVAQYLRHGTTGFVERYLREWVEADRCYRDISLEREAYALERRFANGEVFRVEEELRAGTAAGEGAGGRPTAELPVA